MDVLAVAGKQYAVPTHTHYGTNVLYYNKNLTDAAGVKIPDDGSWTIDEFIEIAKKLTKKEADQWGYWPVASGFSEFGAFWVRQFGGEYFDEEGKKLLIDSPRRVPVSNGFTQPSTSISSSTTSTARSRVPLSA